MSYAKPEINATWLITDVCGSASGFVSGNLDGGGGGGGQPCDIGADGAFSGFDHLCNGIDN